MKLFRYIDPLFRQMCRWYQRPSPSGIVLTSFGGIGDQFLFSFFIDQFRLLLQPGESLTVLMRADAKPAAFLYPDDVTRVYVDFSRLRRLSYRYRIGRWCYRQNFRIAVATDQLRSPDKDEFLIESMHASLSYAMRPYQPKPRHHRYLTQYTALFESPQTYRDKLDLWNQYANWVTGIATSIPDIRLPVSEGSREKLVLFSPFSGNTLKQYAVSVFLDVLERIPSEYRVVLCAHKNDITHNPHFLVLCNHPRIQVDTTPYREQISLIKKAKLVVTVDTAFLHLAVMYNAPTLALMSAAYLSEFPFYPNLKEHVRFIYPSVSCQNCLGRCIQKITEDHYPCIAQLPYDEMMQSIQHTIEEYTHACEHANFSG